MWGPVGAALIDETQTVSQGSPAGRLGSKPMVSPLDFRLIQ